MEDHQRFTWAPVAAAPGQDEELRRLGAQLLSPTGEPIRGNMVEEAPHQRRKDHGHWRWSVGIYRAWGVHFTENGAAFTTQEASNAANAAVPRVVARAAAHDQQEAAIEAILAAARKPEGQWTIPDLPMPGRDERFLRSLQWHVGQGAKDARGGLIWPGYVALAAALAQHLSRSRSEGKSSNRCRSCSRARSARGKSSLLNRSLTMSCCDAGDVSPGSDLLRSMARPIV